MTSTAAETTRVALPDGRHLQATCFNAYFEELQATERAPFATPLIILTASGQAGLDGQARLDWIAGHKRMAALSTHGEQRLVTGSGHAIQLDRPEAVVQAIRDAIPQVAHPR
jgi:pimeloyl-ACP methyl ester carboxylesterase